MKIKSEIIYTDTIYYYKKPVPGYICSILLANDSDEKIINILERDSDLELEYDLEQNTTMSDNRRILWKLSVCLYKKSSGFYSN